MPSFTHRASRLATTLFSVCLALAAMPAAAQQVGVAALPAQPLLETTRDGQDLNFDLIFSNPGTKVLTLERLEVTWFDPAGAFLGQRRLDQNGGETTMGIVTVPNRTLPAGGRLVVFNPFQHFRAPLWLGDLRYSAVFTTGDKGAPEQRVELRVAPTAYVPRTTLGLPVSGTSFIHDGHDLTSHHRRLDITGDMTTHFGIAANFTRYAHDFCVTDKTERQGCSQLDLRTGMKALTVDQGQAGAANQPFPAMTLRPPIGASLPGARVSFAVIGSPARVVADTASGG